MFPTVLQLLGLFLIVLAGVLTSPAAAALAFGAVAVFVGVALERE